MHCALKNIMVPHILNIKERFTTEKTNKQTKQNKKHKAKQKQNKKTKNKTKQQQQKQQQTKRYVPDMSLPLTIYDRRNSSINLQK